MEETTSYLVEITSKAEQYYWELLSNLYQTHGVKSAGRKSDAILELAMSLEKNPYQGSKEGNLAYLNKEHRFLVYHITKRKTIKIIYFVDEVVQKVYITDFFATDMHPDKIKKRN